MTLGTWNIFFALNLWYSGSETIRSQDIEAAAPFLQLIGNAFALLGARITVGSLLMLGMFGLFWYILNWTAYGRHIYAIGDDPDAAAPRRHQHGQAAAVGLCDRRPDLRDRRLGPDRPHRLGQPAGRLYREPRQHHRRGDRRHQPVRRPRLDPGAR